MSQVIDIDLSPAGINRALKAVKAFEREAKKKADEIVEQTARFAQAQASSYYGDYVGDGHPTVKLVPYSNQKGWHVVATGGPITIGNRVVGNATLIAEFGAGTVTDENSELATRLGVTQGSFSSTVGTGEFARTHEYWHHDDLKYTTQFQPTNAMYKASQEAKDRMQELVKENFGK